MESWKAKRLFPQKEHVGSWSGCWLSKKKRYPFLLVELVFSTLLVLAIPLSKRRNRVFFVQKHQPKSWVCPVKLSYVSQKNMDVPWKLAMCSNFRPFCVRPKSSDFRRCRRFQRNAGENIRGVANCLQRSSGFQWCKWEKKTLDVSVSTWFLRTSSRLDFCKRTCIIKINS